MPYRREHSCTIDEEITDQLEVVEKETPIGVMKFVKGLTPAGKKGIRAVRIPAHIPVNEAGRICQTMGGNFSPATPLNPRNQLMREKPCVSYIYQYVEDFEMPLDYIRLSEVGLPISVTCFLMGHKDLPYKYPDGIIHKEHVKGSLSRINRIDASADLKLTALRKLLRLARVYGIRLVEKPKFKVSDLEFFLMVLVEYEAKEEANADTAA